MERGAATDSNTINMTKMRAAKRGVKNIYKTSKRTHKA